MYAIYFNILFNLFKKIYFIYERKYLKKLSAINNDQNSGGGILKSTHGFIVGDIHVSYRVFMAVRNVHI